MLNKKQEITYCFLFRTLKGTNLEFPKANMKLTDLDLKKINKVNLLLKPKNFRQLRNLDISENVIGNEFYQLFFNPYEL